MRSLFALITRGAEAFRERFFSLQNQRFGPVPATAAFGGPLVLGVLFLTVFGVSFQAQTPRAIADDVSTSVTVLNTPPSWTVDAQESTESSTSTPTQSGNVITWIATGTDSSNDSYYLLICKTGSAPTANAGAAPSCAGGGANRWAVSSLTASAAQASAATTTKETAPFDNESNDWYAWICDANATLPRCNATSKQGTSNTASPFVVNHPPYFSAILNTGPVSPGGTITWMSTSSDRDVITGSNDTVQLFVCKANDYTGSYCGSGGSWATSTFATNDPATTTTIQIPTQDAVYAAYVFIKDSRGRVATSTLQGSNSSFTVNNVAPSVTAATISLEDSDHVGNVTLAVPNSTSGPFYVKFTVVDNNSCQRALGGNEISAAITNVYRSSITQSGCDTSGEYNSNNCYAAASGNFSPFLTCSQDVGSCSGSTDSDSTWTCSFPLWYNADPTDASTPWTSDNWLASVQVTDDNGLTSSLTEGTSGNEIVSFLAFDVTQTAIGYGSLQPGEFNSPLGSTTDLKALGNVGLDEDLYGDTMCTTWTAADSCDAGGPNAGTKIPVSNQKYATSSVAYGSVDAFNLTASTSPSSVTINVPKTTSTSSPQTKDTYWGINIPITITQSGSYLGQNTITAKKSGAAFW